MPQSIAHSLVRFAAIVLLASLFFLPAAQVHPIAAQQAAGSTNALSSLPAGTLAGTSQSAPASESTTSSQAAARAKFGRLPLAFEANVGQDKAAVRFKTRAGQATLFFRADDVAIVVPSAPTTAPSR